MNDGVLLEIWLYVLFFLTLGKKLFDAYACLLYAFLIIRIGNDGDWRVEYNTDCNLIVYPKKTGLTDQCTWCVYLHIKLNENLGTY